MARRTPEQRFWAKVNKTDTCWLWTAGKCGPGYGHFYAGREVMAHRFAYETAVGPIPDGLTIDHLCRVRLCVNPAHLEPVTMAENVRRAAALKTHCPKGHELPPLPPLGAKHRRCTSCVRASNLATYYANRRTTSRPPKASRAHLIPKKVA